MSEPVDQNRLARVLAQHARATLLLGVDALPISARVIAAEQSVSAIASMPEPPRVSPRVVQPSTTVEAKPRPQAPVDSAHRSISGIEPSASAKQAVGEGLPPPRAGVPESQPTSLLMPSVHTGDAERLAAQSLLDALRARYEADAPHASFNTTFTNIVFGEGDPRARLMFVGEAPGADEDRTGRPFVGRAGQLLDKMIMALALSREQVYIANELKTRPPDNATPTSEECALCAPYLYEQIAIVRPEAIVTLGLPATRTLLNSDEAMGKLRGVWAEFRAPAVHGLPERVVPLMPTYHPAFLLRAYTKENRQKVWSDLLQAAQRLGIGVPKRGPGDGDAA